MGACSKLLINSVIILTAVCSSSSEASLFEIPAIPSIKDIHNITNVTNKAGVTIKVHINFSNIFLVQCPAVFKEVLPNETLKEDSGVCCQQTISFSPPVDSGISAVAKEISCGNHNFSIGLDKTIVTPLRPNGKLTIN